MDNVNDVLAAYQIKASSMTQRLASVAVLLPLTIALIYWNIWSVMFLSMVCMVICQVEFHSGLNQAGHHPRPIIGISIVLLFCCAAILQTVRIQPFHGIEFSHVALTISILISFIYELTKSDQEKGLIGWALTLAGACYIGGLLSYYILIRGLHTPMHGGWLSFLHISPGASWMYTIFAITWIQDGAAYFVGRSFGRHRMAPVISPKKSWEGAIGGLIASILTAMLAVPMFGLPISSASAAFMGIVGGIFGQIGDLSESVIKRRIGLKDMSNIMPGHGGILDRLDSTMFTGPVLYYLILLLAQS